MRGRGLKLSGRFSAPTPFAASPSVRGRGLKRINGMSAEAIEDVALRARAWIETSVQECGLNDTTSRPPCEGVD